MSPTRLTLIQSTQASKQFTKQLWLILFNTRRGEIREKTFGIFALQSRLKQLN